MAHKVIFEYWQASDGTLWGTQQEAEIHEKEMVKPVTFSYDPCDYCSNNPKNGGSGICNCILGNRVTYNAAQG